MAMIEVKNLKIHYPIRSGFFNRVTDHVLAVDGINFDIEQGETYGLIGESGSGKSTTGKAIVGLEPVTSGSIIYKGEDITKRSVRKRLQYNKDVQMIFQDSLSSLNPRKRIEDIIAEPIRNFQNLTKDEDWINWILLTGSIAWKCVPPELTVNWCDRNILRLFWVPL